MTEITFVTPAAPYHVHLLPRVQATVEAQTVPCNHIIVIDHDGMGAGMARNVGMTHVETRFLVFLDADDTIESTFAEETLAAFDGRYVYTDWTDGRGTQVAPDCHFANDTYNVITCLIPTRWALEVGGFDAALPALEDTDFFSKLMAAGYCGRHLPRSLFHYSADGKRAKSVEGTPALQSLRHALKQRYGGLKMACCGQTDPTPVNVAQDDWVEVTVTERAGQGGQPRQGRFTGRVYGYAYVGDHLYVDPNDADHPSGHFARIPVERQSDADMMDFDGLIKSLTAQGGFAPLTNVVKKTDRQKVIDLWGAPKNGSPDDDPVLDALSRDKAFNPPLTTEEMTAIKDGDTVEIKRDGTSVTTSKRTPPSRRSTTKRK